MRSIKNQKVVVTGSTGGIAHATIRGLVDAGADVVVSARSEEKLTRVIRDFDDAIIGHVMDLHEPASIEAFFDKVGAFDHLVTPAATGMFAQIRNMDFKSAREIVDTKQWGQLLCVHYGVRNIANTGSITLFSGTVTQKPIDGASMFAAVGAASEAAGRIWAFELAPIRVNTVVPGVIETRIWPELMGDETARDTMRAIAEALPVGRVGTADDVAKAVLFLIDNSFVNGHSLVVDGGHRLI
ncbi:MAG: SDR family oxidoreductase [Pseudomonadota bacterium]